MADPNKKQSLILALREARGQLGANLTEFRRDISIGQRFRNSVKKHPAAWYAGAAVLGLLLSRIPPFAKKVIVPQPIFAAKPPKAGIAAAVLTGLKLALDVGKPFLSTWIKDHIQHAPSPRRRAPKPTYTEV